MAEKAALHNNPDQGPVYAAIHFGGGGERGVVSCGVPIFQEMVTGMPVSKLYNHVSGISIGSAIGTILSVPRFENSDEPRFTALDAEEGIKQIIRLMTGPERSAFMVRRMMPIILELIHESEKAAVGYLGRKIDRGISIAIHSVVRRYHDLMGSASQYSYREHQPAGKFIKHVLGPLNRLIDAGLENMIRNARYDIRIPHQAFDLAFRTEDTNRPLKLKDSLTSLHVSESNYTRDEPAHFSHFRNMDNASQCVSDPDMYLDDIVAGSCAAPAYLDYHVARNGEYYMDVGHLDNTPFNSIDFAQDKLGDDVPVTCLSIGTGIEEKALDGRKINNPLHLVIDYAQTYFQKRDTKSVIKKLGKKNFHHIDIALSPLVFQNKYADNPKLLRAARLLGFDLLARDQMDELEKTPSSRKFGNTSPKALDVLSEFKWDMLWHNFETVVSQTKFLIQNCAKQGRITPERAREITEDLEFLYPSGDTQPAADYTPHRPIPNLRVAKSDICFELAPLFNRKSGAVPQGGNPLFSRISRHSANDCRNLQDNAQRCSKGCTDSTPPSPR